MCSSTRSTASGPGAEARRTTSFWALLIGFALALATQTGVLIHQLSFLQEPDKLGSRSAAALAVTVTTIGSIVARLVVGQFIADKADKRVMTVVLFVGQAAAVLLYTTVSGTVAIYAVALLFGFTIGNVYMMMSLLTAEIFGILSFGTVYGVVSLAGQLGQRARPGVHGLGPRRHRRLHRPLRRAGGAQPGGRDDHHVRPPGAQRRRHPGDGRRDGGAPGRMTRRDPLRSGRSRQSGCAGATRPRRFVVVGSVLVDFVLVGFVLVDFVPRRLPFSSISFSSTGLLTSRRADRSRAVAGLPRCGAARRGGADGGEGHRRVA